LALLLVVLLVGRAVEIHHHDDTVAHTESCAVCRALQAPVATPDRGLEFAPLVAPDLHDAHGESNVVVVESPTLGAHLLRAPPLA
jgi:hypothetical protein